MSGPPSPLALATMLAAASLAATPLPAQDADVMRVGDRFVGAWAGASFYSPAATGFGHTPDRNFYLAAARAEWVIESRGAFALAATADVIPLAVVTNNPIKRDTGTAPVYGAGLSPLGLELHGPRMGRVRPYLAGAVGGLWFTRETPEPTARRFNFTFEYGGGVRIPLHARSALMVGYKFHHLSNGYTAPRNPGLDGNVLYLGFMRRNRDGGQR